MGSGTVTLLIHTARISYRGPDRFDITRKSGGPEGRAFAPSWSILNEALAARRAAKREREREEELLDFYRREKPSIVEEVRANIASRSGNAHALERGAWATYLPAYLEEMVDSQQRHPEAWAALLARERVVLCCFCVVRPGVDDSERCHRILLAHLLVSMGARYEGEIVSEAKKRAPLSGDLFDLDAVVRETVKR